MRRAIHASVIVLLLIFVFSSLAVGAEYWGTKNSNKYHYPTCKSALKIKPANLVKFSSPEEAKKAGYVPCKICKPPLSSRVESGLNIAKG